MSANDLIETLYDKYYNTLVTWGCRYVGYDTSMRKDVEDWVQDTFYCALLRAARDESFLEHPNHVGWLVKTLKNRIGNAYQRKQVNKKHTAYSLDMPNAPPIVHDVWDDLEIKIETAEMLEKALSILSEDEYAVMVDYLLDGMDAKEVAAKHGKSLTAVKATIRRVFNKIRKISLIISFLWYLLGMHRK